MTEGGYSIFQNLWRRDERLEARVHESETIGEVDGDTEEKASLGEQVVELET